MKFLFVLILFITNILFSKDIHLLTEPRPPFQIETKNGLAGIGADLIKEIQKKVGNKKDITVFPWKRSYYLTMNKKGYALFLTTRSKEREKLFKWVGPISSINLKFFKNASREDLQINSLDDARKVSSIILEEDTISTQILKKLEFKNLDINSISNYVFDKLIENKADLYISDEISFRYRLKLLNLENKIVPVKMKPFYSAKLYIAFNKDTDDKTIQKWQKALDEIKKDGTYLKILERYK